MLGITGPRLLFSSPPDYHPRWLTLENCGCCPEHTWWRPDGSANVCTLCWPADTEDVFEGWELEYAGAVLFSGLPVC